MAPRKCTAAFEELAASEATWNPSPEETLPESTAGLEPGRAIIGQDRALEALHFGLECAGPGYNVFVCGIQGTGRTSTVRRILEELKPQCRLPEDLCYVNNFDAPERPHLITLPRGKAEEFRDSVFDMVKVLREEIPAIVNSPQIRRIVQDSEGPFRAEVERLATEFQDRLASSGFHLVQVQGARGIDLAWRRGEQVVSMEELAELKAKNAVTAHDFEEIVTEYAGHRQALAEMTAAQQALQRQFLSRQDQIERQAATLAVAAEIQRLREAWPHPGVETWLTQAEKSVLEHIEYFRLPEGPPPQEHDHGEAHGEEGEPHHHDDGGPDMSVFDVNIILTSQPEAGCPIVIEEHPSHQNVFGSQEKISVAPGVYGTDFTRIKGGSLLEAQGGYLIMNASDMMSEHGVWTLLKRTLRSGHLVIQPPEGPPVPGATALNPEPIPLDVKIVLVGSSWLHSVLWETDGDFERIFKIKAEFYSSISLDECSVDEYLQVVVRIIREDGLRDLDRSAVEELLRHGMRMAGRQGRLTTRFSHLADVIREASWHANRAGLDLVDAASIRRAVEGAGRRMGLYEDRLGRMIDEGDLWIPTEGEAIGQANGLTVISTGDYEFGKPARITCRSSVGKSGIINIEREVELSDSSHDKGVLILAGYLRGRYATEHPLAVSASLCFEQSHGYIDGDSASSAEIYALLSSIAKIPLRQDLAVTGAVDQVGAIGSVGGINEKVEGWFKTCRSKGLTGTQGVIIPAQNVRELMLSEDVLEALREGWFHLYPVRSVDEGLEVLTGCDAGRRVDDAWTPESVNDLVQREIDELFRMSKDED